MFRCSLQSNNTPSFFALYIRLMQPSYKPGGSHDKVVVDGSNKMKRGIVIQDEEQTQRRRRRRSTGISLEKKGETELKRMNDSATNDSNLNKQKDKGKQIINEDEQHSKTQKKKARLAQLSYSSLQERQHLDDRSILRTNVPSLNRVPSKRFLESILDILQSYDEEQIFAGLVVQSNEVGDYFSLLNHHMSFATLRAKLQEGLYTTMEHFKHDVCLMFAHAMNSNPPDTRTHQVAKSLSHWGRILLEDPESAPKVEYFQSVNKLPPRTIGHARFRYAPGAPDIATTDKYEPQNDQPIVPSAHRWAKMNNEGGQYHFAEGLGATAQTHDLLANFYGTEQSAMQQLLQQEAAATQQSHCAINKAFDHQQQSLGLSLSYKPPGIAMDVADIDNNKGKNVAQNDDWKARAATILGDYFINSNKKETTQGFSVCSATSSPVVPTGLMPAVPYFQPQPLPLPLPQPQPVVYPVPATSPRWNMPEPYVVHGLGRSIVTPFAPPPPFGSGGFTNWLLNGPLVSPVIGFGGLSFGGWISGFSSCFRSQSVLFAELLDLKNGLELVWNQGFRDVSCETDSLEAYRLVALAALPSCHAFGAVVLDIQTLLDCFVLSCSPRGECLCRFVLLLKIFELPPMELSQVLDDNASGRIFLCS
ncbi:hypothetical protein RIF29_17278 [Crotalaria pallida]|uniref:Bromo domain-containing protein n=1 Tax=Crotalaria pallida TaxID=3830 RepID=A0AAN9IGA8_CROPI